MLVLKLWGENKERSRGTGWWTQLHYARRVTPKGRLTGILMVATKELEPGREIKLRIYILWCDSHSAIPGASASATGSWSGMQFPGPTLEYQSETLGMWPSSLGDSDFLRSGRIHTHQEGLYDVLVCGGMCTSWRGRSKLGSYAGHSGS